MIQSRIATHKDYEAVWWLRSHLLTYLLDLSKEQITAHAVACLEVQTMNWLTTTDCCVILAEEDDKAVGLAVLEVGRYQGLGTGPAVRVPHLWVEPEHRGTTAVSALHRRMAKVAKTMGAERVQFNISPLNRDLVMQVTGNGYEPVGVIYEKELSYGQQRTDQDQQGVDGADRGSDRDADGLCGEVRRPHVTHRGDSGRGPGEDTRTSRRPVHAGERDRLDQVERGSNGTRSRPQPT